MRSSFEEPEEATLFLLTDGQLAYSLGKSGIRGTFVIGDQQYADTRHDSLNRLLDPAMLDWGDARNKSDARRVITYHELVPYPICALTSKAYL